MEAEQRFTEAIRLIDEANAEDPRSEEFEGSSHPRELLFSSRVFERIHELTDDPSEALLLAARAHTLRRWAIPRDQYEMNTVGYHQWRNALAKFHAEEAERILQGVGYPADVKERVTTLILRKNWPKDRDARLLEDADCIVFLEMKLHRYVDEWDEEKMIRILRQTIAKMTPEGREVAMSLRLGERERELVLKAAK